MGREVSEIVFTLMIIGDFIAMVFMFSVFFFTLNFILIKLKPSFVYGNGWKTEDVNMNLMARRMSKRFKEFYTRTPLEKRESSVGEKRVSFRGVEADSAQDTITLGPVPKHKHGQKEEAIYEELAPKNLECTS